MGMEIFFTAKKDPMYGHGDSLHREKGFYILAPKQFPLPKSLLYVSMGTVCTAKRPLYTGIGTLCTAT